MLFNPESEWAYACWRPGDIVLEPAQSYRHALKLTEDGGVVYRGFRDAWGKVIEHDAPIGYQPVDVIGLDTQDMYPAMLPYGRRQSWW